MRKSPAFFEDGLKPMIGHDQHYCPNCLDVRNLFVHFTVYSKIEKSEGLSFRQIRACEMPSHCLWHPEMPH